MDYLTRTCLKCHQAMNGGIYRAAHRCPHCFFEHDGGNKKRRKKSVAIASDADTLRNKIVKTETIVASATHEVADAGQVAASVSQVAAGTMQVEEIYAEEVETVEEVTAVEPPPRAQPAPVVLTTKPLSEQTVLESLEEVTAECVLNLKVTPDLISNGKFIGAKSEKVKAALEQGKRHVLSQLRQKAQERGANIVTDVSVKNAVKTTDSQSVKIIVKASGQAAVVEMAAEVSEA